MPSKKSTKTKTKKKSTKVIKKNNSSKLKLLNFLPALVVTIFASFLLIAPSFSTGDDFINNVLAYATNTSRAGLLSATNTQRANNGASALSLNSQLNSAAQSKAADMVSRGYWSHETPDGQQPWVFITSAGYQYLAAGENLAYGYSDSNSTVIGWMNSPPHRSNLISGNYTEVGFGIANTSDYCYSGDHDNNPATPATIGCKGPQTIVVAMYGKPQVASATTSAPEPTPTAAPVVKTDKPKAPEVNKATPKEEPKAEPEEEIISTDTEDKELELMAAPTTISRIQIMTQGQAVWSATAIILAVCSVGLLWAIHRGIHIKRYVLAGEHFIAKHLHFDLFVLALIFLAYVLLSTNGVIR